MSWIEQLCLLAVKKLLHFIHVIVSMASSQQFCVWNALHACVPSFQGQLSIGYSRPILDLVAITEVCDYQTNTPSHEGIVQV